jgi:hypothetical protein
MAMGASILHRTNKLEKKKKQRWGRLLQNDAKGVMEINLLMRD